MASRRDINAVSSKKKTRIGVGAILIGVLALTLVILLYTARSLRQSFDDGSRYNPLPNQRASLGVPPPEDRHANDVFGGGNSNDIKNNNDTVEPSGNSFHFVVSSDCTSYQRWETLTQLHSAQSVNQCGRFTWIVSGCLDESIGHTGKGKGGAHSDILTHASLLKEVERHFPTLTISNHTIATGMGRSAAVAREHDDCSVLHPHVHFTPDFSDMSVYGGPFADGKKKRTFLNRQGKVQYGNFGNTYKFNNKPNGLRHWADSFFVQDNRRDEAVVLIDPDFIFLNKFELPGSTPPVLPGKHVAPMVLPGNPFAAKYGLGGQFLDFNMTQICNQAPALRTGKGPADSKECPFVSVTNKEVNQFYSAGPPYVIHIEDVRALSKRWSELVPPTYDFYPLLYAEMFAYSMAAADLNLKHNLVKGLFSGCMTGWPHAHGKGELEALELSAKTYANSFGDEPIESVKTDGGASSCFLPPLSPPPFLHYCARYSFTTPYPAEKSGQSKPTYHFFAKRRVNDDVLDCRHNDRPLEPFISTKPEKIEGGNKDWNVLAVCAVVRAINFAQKKGCEAVTRGTR